MKFTKKTIAAVLILLFILNISINYDGSRQFLRVGNIAYAATWTEVARSTTATGNYGSVSSYAGYYAVSNSIIAGTANISYDSNYTYRIGIIVNGSLATYQDNAEYLNYNGNTLNYVGSISSYCYVIYRSPRNTQPSLTITKPSENETFQKVHSKEGGIAYI